MLNRKLLGALAFAGALVGGGVAGAMLGAPVVSLAQEDDSTTTTVEESTEESDDATADEDRPHMGPGGCGVKLATLDVAAETLGITEEALREALEDGQSIADVAEEQGVDVQTVVDALVADANARIDDQVADRDLDADEAAELKEDLPARIEDLVNGEGGFHHHIRRFGR